MNTPSSSNGADASVLREISHYVDSILAFSAADMELRHYSLKFQLEQAADKAAYDSADGKVDKLEHMKRVLQRMIDMALSVAPHILKRTQDDLNKRTSVAGMEGPSTPSSPTSPEMFHNSSVEDFTEGTAAWLESGAHLSFAAIELLSLILVAHSTLRPSLQAYMLEKEIVLYLGDAFGISREHEIEYFQEGYKTEHMKLLANLCFDNKEVSSAIVNSSALLKEVLCGTRVDEENPGMIQWAEFAIRNLCTSTQEAREKIKQLSPVELSEESKKLLGEKVSYSFSPSGKVQLQTKKE